MSELNASEGVTQWQTDVSLEERIKHLLTPPRLYMMYRVRKELWKGEKELRLLPFLVDADRVALDIGANKGVWSDVLRTKCAHVHAFEPNPKMYSLLKAGAGRNVTCHQVALSDSSGVAEFRIPRGRSGHYSNQGGSLSSDKVSENYGFVSVKAERLDDMNIDNIGFMKIDVEGFELQVLKGAQATIARDRPVMIIEIEERHNKRPIEESIASVESLGYVAFALCDNVLTPVSKIDMESRHRLTAGLANYINNFIFFPL